MIRQIQKFSVYEISVQKDFFWILNFSRPIPYHHRVYAYVQSIETVEYADYTFFEG